MKTLNGNGFRRVTAAVGRRSTSRGLRIGVITAVVAFTGSVVAALPASAATSDCLSQTSLRACTTGAVAAHPYGHYVRVSVTRAGCSGSTPWRVFDVANNHTVGSGTGVTSTTIYGLYGSYKASIRASGLSGCAAAIKLDNDWT